LDQEWKPLRRFRAPLQMPHHLITQVEGTALQPITRQIGQRNRRHAAFAGSRRHHTTAAGGCDKISDQHRY